jgi:RNA polymerase sigma-70 factor (ECF subfamily)
VTSDDDLMRAFGEGRREAFDELFQRYRGPVWGFFRRRLSDPERAADLAQDVFLAVVQGAQRYQARASFRSYLFGIAFNVLSSWRRKAGVHAGGWPEDLDPPGVTPDLVAVLAVRRALAELDEDDREIVMLREYDALSYDEIAMTLGIPINTVRSRLFRARLALRTRLDPEPAPLGERS